MKLYYNYCDRRGRRLYKVDCRKCFMRIALVGMFIGFSCAAIIKGVI